jgi:hypothetical protein
MPVVRRLNEAGIENFRKFLKMIRRGDQVTESPAFTFADTSAVPVDMSVRIDQKKFGTKYELAAYLHDKLRPLERPELLEDVGLWSWLALFYIDQLAPVRPDGRRQPREDYHYILAARGEHAEGRYVNRHLVAGPFALFRYHGLNARVLLASEPHQHGEFIFDLAWRTDLISNRALVEAIDRLYFDPKRNAPKRGATTRTNPGNLRRLITVVQQLDFNYDLQGMTAEEILELLPKEFDQWRA